MRAWVVEHPGPLAERPLRLIDRPVPEAGPGEVRIRVEMCGVCRTDLHLALGELAPRRPRTTPGHEVVGTVDARGPGARRFETGTRIGIPWLRSTCGTCRWCRRGRENLCVAPGFTGWDADGGYADFAVVPEAFAYRLPEEFSGEQAAPLLCAGIIGYRALHRSGARPGDRLGIYGFGASAHITAQVAIASGMEVHVRTRGEAARRLARDLGAASVGGSDEPADVPLDASILFAPAGNLVPTALEALGRGGVLAIAGIYLTAVPELDYQRHLFLEREIRTVTANTRADGEEFLRVASLLARRGQFRIATTTYGLEQADQALADLDAGRVEGAAVLRASA